MDVQQVQAGECTILFADARELSSGRRSAIEWLSESERARLSAMSDARADRFLTSRHLLRLASAAGRAGRRRAVNDGLGWGGSPAGLAGVGGAGAPASASAEARAVTTCGHCGSHGHGRVSLPGSGLLVSVAYAGELVLVAAADKDRVAAIGVDAEWIRDSSHRDSSRRGSLPPVRRDDLERWAVVEAVLKADGRGLRVDPAHVTAGSRGPAGQETARVADSAATYRIRRVRIPAHPDVVVALATLPR